MTDKPECPKCDATLSLHTKVVVPGGKPFYRYACNPCKISGCMCHTKDMALDSFLEENK